MTELLSLNVQSTGSDRYFNRELSWLRFDERVLQEAVRSRHPLLERVKFVAISDTNLDEFIMVRVSGLLEQVAANVTERTPDGMTPQEELAAIRPALRDLMTAQRRCLADQILPALAAEGVRLVGLDAIGPAGRRGLDEYFHREVFPICTPLGFDPGHPFPFISNLSVNLAVVLDDGEGGRRFARLKIPTVVTRLIPVPEEPDETFVWLDELIIANLESFFPGMIIQEVHPFRVLRDADVEIQDLEAGDLLESVRASLVRRRFGSAVALQIRATMPGYLRTLLIEKLPVDPADVYVVEGPLGLGALQELTRINRPELRDPPFVPWAPVGLRGDADPFDAIREHDILLHHPFQSFDPIVELLEHAARDPEVLAIKQTLYRVGRDSPVVEALRRAAERGKQVAVLVELKARFDEENNIEWARALERAGVHVTYGIVGLKTHAKLLLVVRRDREGLRRYVHMGTGNYNPSTARLYTDLGLLTCRDDIAADVSELFNYLTGYSRQTHYRKLLVAPVNLRAALLARIEREIVSHHRTGAGRIVFKMNALVDPPIVDALYRAAQAGVQIELLVRGICALRPGRAAPGTIRVTSVLGRFLEHSRIYYFWNGGSEECYLGSADLMPRNLDHRVETLVPIDDPALLGQVRDEILAGYLRDQSGAYCLQDNGRYEPMSGGYDVQADFVERWGEPEVSPVALDRFNAFRDDLE